MTFTVNVDYRPGQELAILRPSALPRGVQFSSGTGKANLVFQYDGNLVVYDEDRNVSFASNTFEVGDTCVFRSDGKLVVFDKHGKVAFTTDTADDQHGGHGGRVLLVQKDGNVVIYNDHDEPIWDIWHLA